MIMKMITKTMLAVGIAALTATSSLAKNSDSLSISIKESFVNNGVETGGSGKVTASVSQQGSSSKSKLDITLAGLNADTDYSLVATINGDGTVDLLDFTTDSKGKASLHFSGSSQGKHNTPLPDGFDLSQVVGLDVINGDGVSVLTADLSAPSSLKYSVKRTLSGDTVTATLQIKASNGKAKLTFTASGLDSDTDYQLVFNGTPVETETSDGNGKLKITIDSDPLPANILDLQTIELWDAGGNFIIGTTTPLP